MSEVTYTVAEWVDFSFPTFLGDGNTKHQKIHRHKEKNLHPRKNEDAVDGSEIRLYNQLM